MRVLLVEDEKELAIALSAALSKHGIITDHTICRGDAHELVLQNDYDAILLDRRLPDGNGLTLIPELRRSGSDTPIIVLTARNESMERVAGLDTGADDYLGKPFLVEELLARIRALLRRPSTVMPEKPRRRAWSEPCQADHHQSWRTREYPKSLTRHESHDPGITGRVSCRLSRSYHVHFGYYPPTRKVFQQQTHQVMLRQL